MSASVQATLVSETKLVYHNMSFIQIINTEIGF